MILTHGKCSQDPFGSCISEVYKFLSQDPILQILAMFETCPGVAYGFIRHLRLLLLIFHVLLDFEGTGEATLAADLISARDSSGEAGVAAALITASLSCHSLTRNMPP